MKSTGHQHVSGRLVTAQVDYRHLPVALETAKLIILTKIKQSQLLLTDYIRSHRRAGYDSSKILFQIKSRLIVLMNSLSGCGDRGEILRIEARAARLHWAAVKLISHQLSDWRRIHPHASDSLNVLLNTGYVLLARKCLSIFAEIGLLPEVGILHGENSREPLVYDFMEGFRSAMVDSVVLPFFSRRKKGVDRDEKIFKKIIAMLNIRYQNRIFYNKRCEQLGNVLRYQALELRSAITAREVWQPHSYTWSHHNRCQR